jgi:hypothetical protein
VGAGTLLNLNIILARQDIASSMQQQQQRSKGRSWIESFILPVVCLMLTGRALLVSTSKSLGVLIGANSMIFTKHQPLPNITAAPSNATPGQLGFVRYGGVIVDFERQPNVVIAVKIHDSEALDKGLKQSLCLLHQAYNRRVLYDILIFSTFALTVNETKELQQIVRPASLTIVVDEKTLQQQLKDLTANQQKTLIGRCNANPRNNITSISDLTWNTNCVDGHFKIFPLKYCWMSEFRFKQIWHQKALKKYRYMIWIGGDSFATQPWKQDPVAFAVRNKLVLLMGKYDGGRTQAKYGPQERIWMAFNRTLRGTRLDKNGRLIATYGCVSPQKCDVVQVHGFFHVTDLDFYRLPQHMAWYDTMIGDGKFSRIWDDQLAVMVPAAMNAPDRTMDMVKAGLSLGVLHNGQIMMANGNGKQPFLKYMDMWKSNISEHWPEARSACETLITVNS